jgi:uncharacterized protein (TIGR00299 family) protein
LTVAHEHGEHAHGGHAHGGGHGPHEHAGVHEQHGALEPGAARGKVLFFDAFSGVAGDMTVAALVDLGVPLSVVKGAIESLPLDGYHLHLGQVRRSGIAATSFDVHVERDQPERTYGSIDAMLRDSPLDDEVKRLSRDIFRKLGRAEANVHKIALSDVHFHEVGAVDAIVDVVGAAAALAWLGADAVIASPLPMGRGFVRARHGILPLPAPAVVDCLAGVPTYGVDIDAELVTPTGAAIVATVAGRFQRWPDLLPERVGWGAGRADLADRPNLLRIVLGRAATSGKEGQSHVIVEANVDDMTGELAGHALAELLAAGALDAWATPAMMKKGRPGLTISALAHHLESEAIASAMLRETSSIGVRLTFVNRVERPRQMIEVATPFGTVPVKVSSGPFGPPVVKPEFDACVRLARAARVSVREVLAAALAAAGERSSD